jgi:hypothetical protein
MPQFNTPSNISGACRLVMLDNPEIFRMQESQLQIQPERP